MIGGTEYIFLLPASPIDDLVDLTLRWMRRRWPNGWVETVQMDGAVPLASSPKLPWWDSGDEVFVYQDETAAQTWDESGASSDVQNRMIHFLFRTRYEPEMPDRVEVTAVVDELTPEMEELLIGWRKSLELDGVSRNLVGAPG